MKIHPIARTEVDWSLYQTAIGRSLTKSLDSHRMPVGSPGSFLVSLGEFAVPGVSPHETLKSPGLLMQHLHFAFLTDVSIKSLVPIANILAVTESPGDDWVIISGTLADWDVAIRHGLTEFAGKELRLFLDIILLYFESLGLGALWGRKVQMPDKTFRLE